jgi:hypothetical protein
VIAINFGDLSQRARRAFKLVGRLPLSLDETVLPVAIVANLDMAPFQTEPRTWQWAASITGSGVAVGEAVISNPIKSGFIVTVKGFHLLDSVATQFSWWIARGLVVPGNLGVGVGAPVLTNQQTSNPNQSTGTSATQFKTGAPAGPYGSLLGNLLLQANVVLPLFFPDPIVLFPGDDLVLSTPTAVTTIQFVAYGAEYVLTSP